MNFCIKVTHGRHPTKIQLCPERLRSRQQLLSAFVSYSTVGLPRPLVYVSKRDPHWFLYAHWNSRNEVSLFLLLETLLFTGKLSWAHKPSAVVARDPFPGLDWVFKSSPCIEIWNTWTYRGRKCIQSSLKNTSLQSSRRVWINWLGLCRCTKQSTE